MNKVSHRDRILTEGLKVVHARGYAGASVRDIVQAAGVPQGSFTNHFTSKEAFGLEVIDLHFAKECALIAATLIDDALQPLRRLEQYVEANINRDDPGQTRNGCLFGNLAIEATDSSEPIRARLLEIFDYVQSSVAYCLRAAVHRGDLARDVDCEALAGFVVASLQGATLMAKAQRSAVPMDNFKRLLFTMVLSPDGGELRSFPRR